MTRSVLLVFMIFFAMAITSASTANADYTVGPLAAIGTSVDQATAAADAVQAMDLIVASFEATLPPGAELVGTTISSWNFDGLDYTITFTIHVIEF